LHPRVALEATAVPMVDQTRCDSLNRSVRLWGAFTAGSAALAGSGGVGMASADLKGNQGAQIGIGVSVAVLSAWGALSAYLFGDYSKQREQVCSQVK
jgi:hypothetical protein